MPHYTLCPLTYDLVNNGSPTQEDSGNWGPTGPQLAASCGVTAASCDGTADVERTDTFAEQPPECNQEHSGNCSSTVEQNGEQNFEKLPKNFGNPSEKAGVKCSPASSEVQSSVKVKCSGLHSNQEVNQEENQKSNVKQTPPVESQKAAIRPGGVCRESQNPKPAPKVTAKAALAPKPAPPLRQISTPTPEEAKNLTAIYRAMCREEPPEDFALKCCM
jgi:hypothetical protein